MASVSSFLAKKHRDARSYTRGGAARPLIAFEFDYTRVWTAANLIRRDLRRERATTQTSRLAKQYACLQHAVCNPPLTADYRYCTVQANA
ncbi:hypothetical protein EVAR_81594_1 [Eumeta japonica]|uniref:Uncharacterized protein n=1 Tax=Eumeta variegata TaxID=151549 RepID=A0A4C1WFV8_EUMVA|nr:hypothetical protein EVAR_81594_1 [Eumeta japonica]